ncbi:hypothetical protein FO519_009540, partial [Halicephalobus sp. NKZ332]
DVEMISKKANLEQVLKKAKKTKELSAEVDEYVPNRDSKQVYVEKKDVYSVMLNQTNIAQNNNKYFLIQVLESTSNTHCWAFFRWGRVGFKGQTNLIDCGKDLEKAKEIFLKKFFDKTLNEFKDRNKFEKVKGKYELIQMDYSKPKELPKMEVDEGELSVESKLDERLQDFLKLICDLKKMEEAARGLSYDINRAPLGKLTKSQIKAGYEALTRIEKCILSNNFNKEFREAVDEYYTRIPHYFGMRVPSPIRDIDELKQELELLEVLSEIEAAVSSINQELKTKEKLHPIDQTYQKLKCEILPLESDSERFKLVETYLRRTHAATHDSYKMKLRSVYEVNKHGEQEKFKKELGNRRLLWHGSRLTNWHGILSRGLQIAPKEAPMTGYMFGKGVYFADMSSKSANYCCPKPGNVGVFALAEVALGEMNPKFKADSRGARLPEGKQSVQGIGDIGPNPSEFVNIDDDVLVPCGSPIEQEETKNIKNNDLCFNEYVVYDTNQIRLRYLVEVEFETMK